MRATNVTTTSEFPVRDEARAVWTLVLLNWLEDYEIAKEVAAFDARRRRT